MRVYLIVFGYRYFIYKLLKYRMIIMMPKISLLLIDHGFGHLLTVILFNSDSHYEL